MRRGLIYTFLLGLFLGIYNISFSQEIRGAEFIKYTVGQELIIRLKVYRDGDSKDSVLVEWGDNQDDLLFLSQTQEHSSGFRIDTYFATHQYDTSGIFQLRFVDSFLVEKVVNIENSNLKNIDLRDSVRIFPENHAFSNNYMPEFFPTQFSIEVDNGLVSHWAYLVANDPFMADDHIYSLVPFPSEGYSFPQSTSALYMNNALLVWNKPISSGTYAFCIQVREKREDFYDEFPGDSILMSTTHRAMMIDIDSSMLVSSTFSLINGVVSIFPNPTSDFINIQASSFKDKLKVTVLNINGVEMFTERLSPSNQLADLQIPVDIWPSGLYLVKIESGGHNVIRKVVIQR